MKKLFGLIGIVIFGFLFSACGTHGVMFNGSRLGNESQLVMDFSVLNKTETQSLTVGSGDTISAKIVVDSGSLSVKIQKDDETPIYENNISESAEFDIDVEDSGIYTLVVIGDMAKGNVDFEVIGKEVQDA